MKRAQGHFRKQQHSSRQLFYVNTRDSMLDLRADHVLQAKLGKTIFVNKCEEGKKEVENNSTGSRARGNRDSEAITPGILRPKHFFFVSSSIEYRRRGPLLGLSAKHQLFPRSIIYSTGVKER